MFDGEEEKNGSKFDIQKQSTYTTHKKTRLDNKCLVENVLDIIC